MKRQHSGYLVYALFSLFCMGFLAQVSVAAAAIAAPAAITVPVTDPDGSYSVNWGPSTTAGVSYHLQEATNVTFSSGVRTAYTGLGLTTKISGRGAGRYFYRVQATKDGATPSAWTVGGDGCVVPCRLPGPLTVPSSAPDGSYTVSWGASATAGVTYVVQEATNSAFTAGVRIAHQGPALTVAIVGNDAGTYYYRVRATKQGKTASAWQRATQGCAVPCRLPGPLTVPVSDPDGSYAVSWEASATTGVSYRLQEATTPDFSTGVQTVFTGKAFTAPISDRPMGTYYYRVAAFKAGAPASSYRPAAKGCAVPGELKVALPVKVTVPSNNTDGSYTISWTASATPGVTYLLQEATNSGFTKELTTVYVGPGLSTSLSGRLLGKIYYYRVLATRAGYRDSGYRTAANGCSVEPNFEAVRLAVLKVIEEDAGAQGTTPLTPAGYQVIADKIAAVPGVQATDYVGDTLGTIQVKVINGGVMLWRHIKNDLAEAPTLPAEADFTQMKHPTYNQQWQEAVATPQSNTYGTHFPVASANPDPEYTADGPVECPDEGKIAIVDFLWTEASTETSLYETQFVADGVMLYDRIRMMAEAAGFTLDIYKDAAINAGNVSLLRNYKIVIFVGHGGRPGIKSSQRIGHALSSMLTAEIYAPNKMLENGIPYEKAWKDGYILYNVKTKAISWTSWFLRDFYSPAPEQLVMANQCWGMLPFNVGFYQENEQYVWHEDMTSPVYNLGDGLKDAGVKVVMGYITPATPEAVVKNTMPFLRRLFGGYSSGDKPPWPHTYWPTCMSAQTFFRLPWAPQLASYAPKFTAPGCIYTMYAVPEAQYFREVCRENANRHAYMQSFMLKVGTPATALPLCWDSYWGQGTYPSGIQDPLCSQGDNPTTEAATLDAACAVKEARQVTNAILRAP